VSTHTEPNGLLLLFTQDVVDVVSSCGPGFHSEPIGLLLLFGQCVGDVVVVPPPPDVISVAPRTYYVEIKKARPYFRPKGLPNRKGW
jgi:hypothetical protein